MNNAIVIKDQEARRDIIEDLDTCMLVEAGAGSGKTYSLVSRMVALIKENKCSVDKLAAVTFTRKSAAELKGRFQLALEKALVEENDPNRKERLNKALNELDRCFLGTIHSFCATLLRERPIEAGLDPDFVELEKVEDTLLREKVWEDYIIRVQTESPLVLDQLLKIDINVQDLKESYKILSGYPEVEIVRETSPAPDLKPVREELYKLLEWSQTVLPDSVPQKGWDDLQNLLQKALRWRRILEFNEDIAVLRLLGLLDKEGHIILNRWLKSEDARAAQDIFNNFRDNYLTPTLRIWREHRHARLVDFVLPAVELYERRRRECSKLNFQDLLMNTAGLLKSKPEVRQYFQDRYSHLLVDEFQDTDPIQAEIMFYLTGQNIYEQDWRRLIPYPGSLFVVGDPKQSIYRFRRADIDTYNEVKKLIAQNGGKVPHLTSNFRSVQAVGAWANQVFQTLLPKEANPYQAAFTGLDTVRTAKEVSICGVRVITIPKVNRNRQEEIARVDAEQIARWIRWAIDGGVSLARTDSELEVGLTDKPRPSDFMILLRYKSYIDTYARCLEKLGIPFHIAGGNGFSQSTEMTEVVKLFKVLIDPDDMVRLVAVLRGSLFGISDNQLWLFKQAGGRYNYYTEVPTGINHKDRETFEWAFNTMRTFREWTQNLPASVAMGNILRELGIIPYTLTGELGKSRSGHIMQCLEFLAAAEGRGITSFASLVDYLTLLMNSGVEEEISIAPWENDTVRLMNLHKAKGLEALVVFLANPGKSVSCRPTVHINRVGDTPHGYFVIEKRKEYKSEILGRPLDWDKYSEIEQYYLGAEEIRLLYVAATRAKNLLVISTYPAKPEASPWHLFNGHFAGVSELEECNDIDSTLIKTGDALTQQDLARARENFLGPGSLINNPGYFVASVTSLVKRSKERTVRKNTGRGQSWGRVIHRILETCAKKTPANLDLFVENIIAEEGRVPEEKEQVLNLVEKILESSLWQRMLKSKKRFIEVPFSAKINEDKYGISGETLISGAIDLIFQENDGWVIVDYKTDTLDGDEMLAELVEYYAPQVQIYKEFWEDMAGAKVHEAGLYFTHINQWVVS